MSVRTTKLLDDLNTPPQGSVRPPLDAHWTVLDRLVQDLAACPQAALQVRLALEAVRALTRADAAYWYPGSTGQPLEMLGDSGLTARWCRDFTHAQVATAPDAGSCLFQSPGPAPHSAALVRLSQSRSTWIVALSFRAGRCFRSADLEAMTLIRQLLLQQRQRARAQEQLKEALLGTVRGLVAAVSAKCPYTGQHSERVARLAVQLGRRLGLSAEALGDLHLAGLLHDVGKIGIRTEVLQELGPLSDEDFAHLREHPVIGEGIVSQIGPLTHLCPGVRHHHERYDGRGYPDGLAGEEIPLLARILALADGCDAMLSARPYRPALAPARVEEILAAGAGSQWDPALVGQFLACRREVYAQCQQRQGDSVQRAVEGALCAVRQEAAAAPLGHSANRAASSH
jgi:hypothetical protein